MHYVRKWVCGWERQWNFAISSNTFASSACFKIIENRVLWVCVWWHSVLLVWELFWSQNWRSFLIFINLQRQALNLCPFSRNKKRFVQSVKPLVLQLTLFLMINSTIGKKSCVMNANGILHRQKGTVKSIYRGRQLHYTSVIRTFLWINKVGL